MNNPLGIETKEQLEAATICKADSPGDYENSGFVLAFANGHVGIGHFSHCSCFDTWDSLNENDRDGLVDIFNWIGTPLDFLEMAKKLEDPQMPGRKINEADYDYHHLMTMYEEGIKFFRK